MKNELMTFDDIDTSLVKEANLPEIIGGQLEIVKQLDKKVSKAMNLADKAKDAADDAYSQSAGFWHRKAAIESVQGAVLEIGEATAANAESQKLMFDYMQKLAQVTKNLFALGCSSIAMNRLTVRELELKLNGASKEKLSELAKKELMNVVTQLKQQEDIMNKQEKLSQDVKANSKQIQSVTDIAKDNKSRLEKKDEIDAAQTQRLEELGALLQNKDTIDQKQEEEISKNKENISKNADSINKNAEAIKLLFEYTKQKDELDKQQSKEIDLLKTEKSRASLVFSIISFVFSIAALALGIFSYCLK